jgi:hypothetical protein
MESVYADRLQSYGRHWHYPWLIWLAFTAALLGLCSLAHRGAPTAPLRCDQRPGTRFRAGVAIDGLAWTADLEAALACASRHGRRVFVAFHAEIDTAARFNEVTAFRDPDVRSAFDRYVLVMLYMDSVPACFYGQAPSRREREEDGAVNAAFEQSLFDTAQEPLYVILQRAPNGQFEILDVYDETRITDASRFVRFLRHR